MATKNNSLILFDKDFNLIDEKPLDDGEGVKADELVLEQCGIAWRFDSNVKAVGNAVLQCCVWEQGEGNEELD
jgi:hypothetical protein